MPRKADKGFAVLIYGNSFNEAGAVMPRKACFRSSPSASAVGFNEAGAVMPRKVGVKFGGLLCAR